jgi:DNA helicase-2/ATP-dependent DNA helicase PcrA
MARYAVNALLKLRKTSKPINKERLGMPSKFPLNEQQQHAVRARGKVIIVAGAGSGKTRVLTQRVVQLVEEDSVNPSNICAITFTKKAATEMQERLSAELGDAVVDTMQVSTIHSLTNRILMDHYSTWFRSRPSLVREWEAVKACTNGSSKEEEAQARTYLTIIGRLKNEGIIHETAVQLFEANQPSSQENLLLQKIRELGISKEACPDEFDLLEAWTRYDAWCCENSKYDFDDMLVLPWSLLKQNPAILRKYQDRWTHILVDEYQDTSIVQVETIEMIAQKADLFVVGDDDQSIYEWRGAHPNLFLGFEVRHPNATRIYMERNYRSGKTIIQVSNSLITHNEERFQKSLFTEIEQAEVTGVLQYDTMEEARFVVSSIGQMINGGANPRDFAILMRCNYQSAAFEPEFVKAEIPYWPMNGISFYDRKVVQDVLAYLRLIVDPEDDSAIARIYNRPLRWLGNTWLNSIKMKAKSYGSIWRAIENEGVGFKFKHGESDLISMIKTLRGPQFTRPSDAISGIMDLGYRDYMFRNNSKILEADEDYMGDISALYQQAMNYKTIEDFLTAIEAIRKAIKGSDPRKKNAVAVGTVHKAKGLEWPIVFVVGFNEGLMPHSKGLLNEERRLAYVAFTRAQTKLIVVTTSINSFGKSAEPSRFLMEAGIPIINQVVATPEVIERFSDDEIDPDDEFGEKI